MALVTLAGASSKYLPLHLAAGSLQATSELLSHESRYVVQKAAWIIHTLSDGSSQHRDAIASAGCLPLLVRLLSRGFVDAKLFAIFRKEADGSNSRCNALIAAGILPPLVKITGTSADDDMSYVHVRVLKVIELLRYLDLWDDARRDAFLGSGGLRSLVALLGNESPTVVKESAKRILVDLAGGSDRHRDATVAEGCRIVHAEPH